MKIDDLLTELVLIADTLDKQGLTDVSADIDAATYILSDEGSKPIDKSLASIVRAQYASLNGVGISELEAHAIEAAESIVASFEDIVKLEPRLAAAILESIARSAKSFLEPVNTLSEQCIKEGAELLAEAENKLVNSKYTTMGYRVGVIRSKLEKR